MQPVRPVPRPPFAFRAAALTKVFGSTVALWDVNVDSRSGELLAILGGNGSGKSTLLRIIAGLMAPTRGRIAWTSEAPGTQPRIGLLGHASHLFDELTAIENVAFAARLARRDEAIAIDLIGRLGVGPSGARMARDLSAGTRRRVGLARVLASGPDVIIVDEPFAGLDASAAELVGHALAGARDDGRLVVIATHDDSRSRSLGATEAWLDGGRLRSPLSPRANGVAT